MKGRLFNFITVFKRIPLIPTSPKFSEKNLATFLISIIFYFICFCCCCGGGGCFCTLLRIIWNQLNLMLSISKKAFFSPKSLMKHLLAKLIIQHKCLVFHCQSNRHIFLCPCDKDILALKDQIHIKNGVFIL